jgi:hypothetical protein
MAVTAPSDANDSFVSIERFGFAGSPQAGTSSASTLQGTVFTAGPLTNVATYYGLQGTIELGCFDGSARTQHQGTVWTDLLERGIERAKQALQAGSSAAKSAHAAPDERGKAGERDWITLEKKDEAPAAKKGLFNIDWKSAVSWVAAPFLSGGKAAPRAPTPPSNFDFKVIDKGRR